MSEKCDNCGDGSGWSPVWMNRADNGRPELVLCACADCNDDAGKPVPELCEGCGFKAPDCECAGDPLFND